MKYSQALINGAEHETAHRSRNVASYRWKRTSNSYYYPETAQIIYPADENSSIQSDDNAVSSVDRN